MRLTRLPAVVTRIESDGCLGGKSCHTTKIREESAEFQAVPDWGNRLLRIVAGNAAHTASRRGNPD